MKFIDLAGPLMVKNDTIFCIGSGTDSFSYHNYFQYLAKYDLKGNFISITKDSMGLYYYYMRDAYW